MIQHQSRITDLLAPLEAPTPGGLDGETISRAEFRWGIARVASAAIRDASARLVGVSADLYNETRDAMEREWLGKPHPSASPGAPTSAYGLLSEFRELADSYRQTLDHLSEFRAGVKAPKVSSIAMLRGVISEVAERFLSHDFIPWTLREDRVAVQFNDAIATQVNALRRIACEIHRAATEDQSPVAHCLKLYFVAEDNRCRVMKDALDAACEGWNVLAAEVELCQALAGVDFERSPELLSQHLTGVFAGAESPVNVHLYAMPKGSEGVYHMYAFTPGDCARTMTARILANDAIRGLSSQALRDSPVLQSRALPCATGLKARHVTATASAESFFGGPRVAAVAFQRAGDEEQTLIQEPRKLAQIQALANGMAAYLHSVMRR